MILSTSEILDIFNKYNIKINGVLHIGAHECEENSFYRSMGLLPEQIIWIDGLERKVLECKSKNISNVFHAIILDIENEMVTFNETNNGQSSSILEFGTHKIEHPNIYVTKKYTLKTTTIDHFMKKNNFDPKNYNFWNIDIQGAEYKALLGGINSLMQVDVLYLEVNEQELYKNCVLLPELDSFLNMRGFTRILTKMTPNHWGDAIYINQKFIENKLKSNEIVYVDAFAGMGNQLFQVATAYAYARKEHSTLQILYKTHTNGSRPFYWDTILKNFKPFIYTSSAPSDLIKWKESCSTKYEEIPSVPNKRIHLNGYFQSTKYFYNDMIKNEIKHLFKPDIASLEYILNKYENIINNKKQVIVVHARRTDYIQCRMTIDVSYYKKAIEKMLLRVENPTFVFSSDDLTFWDELKRNIPCLNNYPSFLIRDNDINTFILLQQFENYIMSNSTFCWWAIWLSNSKHVITPSKWYLPKGTKDYDDIYEKEWERI
jgi:FkbM family methyltransferase